ncbi:MAG: PEGA domain-containing protein, partial [Bacteroidales bacterium]|nr:PEGA domain-containing protein [Bacteroidales bacterium]
MNKSHRRIAKNALLLLVLILLQGTLLAQNISVKSFRPLPEDLTARVDPVTNENGQTCALVKIVTTERGFSFEP